jgi:hypothetical protein
MQQPSITMTSPDHHQVIIRSARAITAGILAMFAP